jgi:hypothetical protein
MLLLLLSLGQLAMRVVSIAVCPASTRNDPSSPRHRKSKGTMPPHRWQPGGALGRPDADGAIRWMLEQFKAVAVDL